MAVVSVLSPTDCSKWRTSVFLLSLMATSTMSQIILMPVARAWLLRSVALLGFFQVTFISRDPPDWRLGVVM